MGSLVGVLEGASRFVGNGEVQKGDGRDGGREGVREMEAREREREGWMDGGKEPGWEGGS